jgi:hypothetical protein
MGNAMRKIHVPSCTREKFHHVCNITSRIPSDQVNCMNWSVPRGEAEAARQPGGMHYSCLYVVHIPGMGLVVGRIS